eukprot:55981-Eustigmatos_ZCMA.PRE.1
MVIPVRPVHQQHAEVDGVEIWRQMLASAEQTPRQTHHPIARIIDLARKAPPAGRHQLSSARCVH